MPYQLDDFGRPTSIRFTPIKVTHAPLPKAVHCALASFPLFTKTNVPEIDPEELEEQHCTALVEQLREHPGVSLKTLTQTKTLKKALGSDHRIRDILKICLSEDWLWKESL